MMNHTLVRRFLTLGTLIVAGAFVSLPGFAANLYVGGCGSPNYATIQLAVTHSSSGANIFVCPGSYAEQVTITHNVNLIGVKTGTSDAAIITSPSGGVVQNTIDTYVTAFPVAAQILVQNANNVNLSNIIVDGSNNQLTGCGLDLRGIYYQNASGSINEVVARNQILPGGLTGCQSGEGIFVQSGYSSGQANVLIQNSSVHGFQKNGITVDGPGAQGRIFNNFITGVGPTSGAAENGIQISDAAQGNVQGNVVADNIWAPDVFGDTGNAASGILVYSSQNVQIENNTVSSTQYGIVTVTDPAYGITGRNPGGLGDKTIIINNAVLNTKLYDAIDLCSNSNVVQGNVISNAGESGIHLDSTCGSTGKNNVVNSNAISDSCAGVLQGGTPNTIGNGNVYNDVTNTILAGDVCSTVSVAAVPSVQSAQTGVTNSTPGHPTPVK